MTQGPANLDKAKKGRNFAIAIGIASLMAVFFFITLAKFVGS